MFYNDLERKINYLIWNTPK